MSYRTGMTLIILANVLGGVSFLWQKLAAPGLPASAIAAGRSVVGIACLYVWARRRSGGRLSLNYTRGEWTRITITGVVAFGLPMILGIIGVTLSTVSNGSILILLEPAALLVFARILLGDQVRVMQAVGIAVGLVGAWLIVTDGADMSALLTRDYALGNTLLLIHAALWGLYSPLAKPLAERHDPVGVTLAIMLASMVLLVPSAVYELSDWQPGPETATALVYTVVLGVLVSFGSTVMWTLALRALPSGSVAASIVIQPLAGVLAATIWLGETLTQRAVLGTLVIAASFVLVIARPKRAATTAT